MFRVWGFGGLGVWGVQGLRNFGLQGLKVLVLVEGFGVLGRGDVGVQGYRV